MITNHRIKDDPLTVTSDGRVFNMFCLVITLALIAILGINFWLKETKPPPTLNSSRFEIVEQDGDCLIVEDNKTGKQYAWLPSHATNDDIYDRGGVIELG